MDSYSPYKGKSGLKRILNATSYSISGFKAAYQNEAAFRQIVLINLVLIPVSFFLDVTRGEHALMIIVCLFAIIVELFNSAIEAVVDRVSLEKHQLSKMQKIWVVPLSLLHFLLLSPLGLLFYLIKTMLINR